MKSTAGQLEIDATLRRRLQATAAIAAATLPSLLAYNLAPSPTFLNQALALAAWGLWVAVVGGSWQALRATGPLTAALALVGGAALASWTFGSLPSTLALSAAGTVVAAMVMVAGGAAARARSEAPRLLDLFFIGWVVAGMLGVAIALIQVFAPAWPDGDWIARSGLAGRAVGNLRQPNHLSSLLMWAAVAVAALQQRRRLGDRTATIMMALLMLAVVLTGSRTGWLSVGVLAAWGIADRGLAPATRRLLVLAPVFGLACWLMLWAAAHGAGHDYVGEQRLAMADLSSSRFGIWGNTLALIARHPWAGVGFGEFNLAWSMTPFPGRPTAFFDHTHNLALQLLVELGLPLGSLVLGLLGWALWRGWRGVRDTPDLHAALVWIVMIGIHSMLEYPLWYAYFLLPAAWAWGYALGKPAARLDRPAGTTPVAGVPARSHPGLFAAGLLMALAAAWSVTDYLRVAAIFSPRPSPLSLAERVTRGQGSVLFGHHADYVVATAGMAPGDPLAAFARPRHYLLDTRLMSAWARALHAAGDEADARYVAARLREFGADRAPALFADCADPASAASSFACQATPSARDWRQLPPP